MSQLTLYSQFNMRKPFLVSPDIEDVAGQLTVDGIRFEQWESRLSANENKVDEDTVFGLYHHEISIIKKELGLECTDYVSVNCDGSSSVSLRGKFLSEHTHIEDEVRFFVSGTALVYIHINERIHIVQCVAGDFLVIPKGIKHWFDMGPDPKYSCIRWYGSEDGLRNQLTGSYIAESTSRWESIIDTPPP